MNQDQNQKAIDLNMLQAQQMTQEQGKRLNKLDIIIQDSEKQLINAIYKNLLSNIDKQYNLILIDCPWKFNNSNSPFSKLAPPYKCLSFEQLKVLPVKYLASQDCILLMWVVQSHEDDALKLIKQWGFNNHKDFIIWAKTRNGKIVGNDGSYSIVNTEKLWICTRGNVKRFLTDCKVRQLQITDVSSHSEKPKLILDKINARFKLSQMNCLELFARKRYLQEFDIYGDGLKPNFQLSTKYTFAISRDKQINELQVQSDIMNIRQKIHLRKLKLSPEEKKNRIDILLTSIINPQYKNNFSLILQKYIQIFAFSKQEFGLTDVIFHEIELNKDAQASAKAPYKVPPKEDDFILKELQLLLKLDCIEKSKSNWASPIVLVRKSDGSLRMCIDYRALNKATKRDEYPLPRIDVILSKVAKGKIFSRLDLKSGFWQISLRERDKYLTSFTSTHGTYQWKVMPFGLTNAPATFQRCMDQILKDYINKFCCVYIDDIIIYSDNFEQHLQHIQKVFQTLENVNLRLSFDKCEFFKPSIQLLGHEVSYLKYSPLKSRTDAITQMQPPIDKKGVMSFLGLINYYGSFIPNLAIKAKPLRELTKQNVHFKWFDSQQQAFETLKNDIAKETFLHIPEDGKVMTLYTDFSENGIDAVLSQKVDDKQERVIEFASRTLKRHEYNYPAYKGELLAINWAMQKFRYYLLQAPFRLVIDNLSAVQILQSTKDNSKKSSSTLNGLQKSVLRWLMQMQEYSFTPIHRQGLKHNNADALSRLPIKESIDISCITILQQQCYKECHPIDLSFLSFTSNDDLYCTVCRKLEPSDNMIICESCGDNYHSTCHKPRIKYLPKGAWYCKQCIQQIEQMQIVDVTLNFPLIKYLKDGVIPDEYSELDKETLINIASTLYLDEHERLIKLTPKGERTIPTIVERKMIISESHHLNGHMSPEKFISLLSNEYYWSTMRKDIEKYCAQCESCALFNANYREHPVLHPIEKGDRPCATWVIDLTSKMSDNTIVNDNVPITRYKQKQIKDMQNDEYVTNKGNKYLIIAVDPYSKHVELGALPNKNSETILDFFVNSIMKRFGIPCTVRTDQGTEFQGVFNTFLEDTRIQHIQCSRAYLKANGQVERIIRTLKACIKKYYNQPINQLEWDQALPIIQMTQNAVASASTKYSPHEIIFGRPMNYVSSIVVQPPIYPHRDPTEQEIDTYVKTLKKVQSMLHDKVKQNLLIADDKNKVQYDNRKHKQQLAFKENDIVYVKLLRTNKFKFPSRGPYMFIKYTNNNLNAQLKQLFGQQKLVVESTANIYSQQATIPNEDDDVLE